MLQSSHGEVTFVSNCQTLLVPLVVFFISYMTGSYALVAGLSTDTWKHLAVAQPSSPGAQLLCTFIMVAMSVAGAGVGVGVGARIGGVGAAAGAAVGAAVGGVGAGATPPPAGASTSVNLNLLPT